MRGGSTYKRPIQNNSPSPSYSTSLDGENSLSTGLDTYGDSNVSFLSSSRHSRNMERSRDTDHNISYIRNSDFSQVVNNNSDKDNIDTSGSRTTNNAERSSSSRNRNSSKSEKEFILKQLRQHYELANERAVKLAASSSVDSGIAENALSEAHQSSTNIYSALSALLYATISVAKIDALETYVTSRAKHLPSGLFDMNEWEPILIHAKKFRNSEFESLSLSSSFPMKASRSNDFTHSTRVIPLLEKQQGGNEGSGQSMERENAKLKEKIDAENLISEKKIAQLQHSLSSLSTNYKALKDENDRLREEIDLERLRADRAVQSSQQQQQQPSPATITEVSVSNDHDVSTYERTITQLRKTLADKSAELTKKDSVIDGKNILIEELRNNMDESKKLGPCTTTNPETLDVVSQQAIGLVSSSIRASVVKVTASEVENKLSDTPENIINDLLNELQSTKTQLSETQNKLRDVSKSSIPNGSRCILKYLSNNQSDQQCKIEIKTMSNPSTRTDIIVDAEQFKDAYSVGRTNDYVIQLNSDQPFKSHQQYGNDETTVVQFEKKNEMLSNKISHLSQRVSDQDKKLLEQNNMLEQLRVTNTELQNCNTRLNEEKVKVTSNALSIDTTNSINKESKGGSNVPTDDLIRTLNRKLVVLQNENMQLHRKLNPAKDFVVHNLQSYEGKLKVAVIVQRVVRGFLGRVRYLKRMLERQGNADKLLACAGTKQGQTGWYIKDDNSYYYFCRSGHNFILLCGPLSKNEYITARNEAVGQEKRYKTMVKVDVSAVFACKTQFETLFEKCSPVAIRRHSKSKQELQNQVHFPATAVINDLDKKVDELTRDLKVEKRGSRRRSDSFSSFGSGKVSPRTKNKCLVLIQKRVRMLLAMLSVGRMRCEKYGHLDTDYVAMPHTKRGGSGWYMKRNKCYYMVAKRVSSVSCKLKINISSKETQLVKVVGPIDLKEHGKIEENTKKKSVGDQRITLDYSCVVALESRLMEVNQKLEDMENYHSKVSISGPSPEIQAQLKSYVSEIRKLREQLKLKSEVTKYLTNIQADPLQIKKVVKVQSIIRKFIAKCRVSTKRLAKLATEQGILVATERERQGESGWYMAPDGSLYYFALNGKEWNLVAGPVSPEIYGAMVNKTRTINMKCSELKSGDQLIPLSSEIVPTTKASFKVRNLEKKLYVNTDTKDIFVCAPISISFLLNHGNTRHCPFCSAGTSVSEEMEREKMAHYFSKQYKITANEKKDKKSDKNYDVSNAFAVGGGYVQRARRSDIKLPAIQS